MSPVASLDQLVSVRASVEPRLLEPLLDALAHVPFPINPEICHGWPTTVEFPAYSGRVSELRRTVLSRLPEAKLTVRPMADVVAAA